MRLFRVIILLVFAYGALLCLPTCSSSSASGPRQDAAPQSGRSSAKSAGVTNTQPLLGPIGDSSTKMSLAANAIWSLTVDHIITNLHVTSEGEIVAIGPNQITLIDQKGRHRWHRNLAPGDQVLPSDRCLFVHLSSSSTVSALDDRGQPRWERGLDGTLAPLGDGTLLSADAAAVRVVKCKTGSESWMFAPDRIRSLRFLSVSNKTVSLLGELGQRRILYTVGIDGQITSTTELPLETEVARVLSNGTVLARTSKTLHAVAPEGSVLWTQPVTARTELGLNRSHIVLADSSADGTVTTRILTQQGTLKNVCTAKLGAEPVSVKIYGRGPLLLAACAGALSSCANRGLSSGPHNRLWECSTTEDKVSHLVTQRSRLYFDMVQTEEYTVAVATPDSGQSTYMVQMDSDLRKRPLTRLAERRMFGPISGPNGLWLVATCHGVHCESPWTLLAIDGRQEE